VRRLDVEADLRFEGPTGPGHVTADTAEIVVRVPGWIPLARLAIHLWRRGPGGASPRRLARQVARVTGRPVYVDAGSGPRIRLALPPD
jgi:hypothetical protein